MLIRMPLQAQVNGFGFYQAAFAGMVAAATTVTEIPRWTGDDALGRRIALAGCLSTLAVYGIAIASVSRDYRLLQTEPVGSGRDRFYALDSSVDETGALVNWAVRRMKSTPPEATLLVFPEGAMINYLSRHIHPLPSCWLVRESRVKGCQEQLTMNRLRQAPPDYVILISRNLREHGITQYDVPGTMGYSILKWVMENYRMEGSMGGNPLAPNDAKGVALLSRNTKVGRGAESQSNPMKNQ
jgi:hypothetical protein